MKNTSFGFGYGRFGILWCMAVLLSGMFPAKAILAGQEGVDCPPLAGVQGVDKCELSEAKHTQQSLSGCGDKTAKTEVVQKVQKLQIPFIANNGQTDERVKFYANTFGGTVFITKEGEIVYSLNGDGASRIALKETLIGGKVRGVTGKDTTVTNVNYFKGKDPSQWKTGITTYDAITLGEVYKGIELRLKAYGNNVEKLFYVKPEANPELIGLTLNGAKALRVNEEGQLEAETEIGPVKFTKPVAYQEVDGKRVDVAVEYSIQKTEAGNKRQKISNQKYKTDKGNGNGSQTYGFKVAFYDKTKDLIIDPLLASTFLGGTSDEYTHSITIDTSGNVYIYGHTYSSDFPSTGGYDSSFNGGTRDIFVSKFNSDLTSHLVSTYLGGSSYESGGTLLLDSSGNVYIAGYTASGNFPTTTGAYQTSSNGGDYDAFVSKLSGDLSSLIASTYLGGSLADNINAIAMDSSGNIYATGDTYSTNFPITTGAYQSSYGSRHRGYFVSKLNGNLTSLLASTYLGGSSVGDAICVAVDSSGNVYVTGQTVSGFPTTAGAYQTSYGGGNGYDAFVSKLSGDLTSLIAATYLGGSLGNFGGETGNDSGYFISAEESGIYIVGATAASDFPTTTGAYQTSHGGGGSRDVFVAKLSVGLDSLLSSTFLGSSGDDVGNSMIMDSSGNVYVVGYTGSTNYPTTTGAYRTSLGGSQDAFISKLSGDLKSLLASTYLGGSANDRIYEIGSFITIDSSGNIYVMGQTQSSNFPTTSGVYDTSYNGSYDTFIAKLDSNLSATPSDTTAPSGSISINSGASYTNSSTVTLTLSATDATGVTGYYLSDSSSTPSASASGWTSVTSTTSYSATVSYSLSGGEGSKTLYAWYKDAAGNVSITANATITLDTTLPTVTISSPTSSSTYTATSSTISLGGSASDSSSGISSVAWSNNRGGNGTATGTASWTVSNISLSTGDNVITVTAKDGANNSGTDTVQVTYGTPTTVSAPTVSTGSASSVTTSSATLNGIINANGGTTTAWFQYGSTSGSYGNTSSTQTVTGSSNTTVSIGISGLSSGTNYYYRIAAQNSAGTSYGSESSFTTTTATATPIPTPSTGDSTAPTDGSITINSGASYTNSTGVTLTLSAKDNTGVTGYYLSQNSSTPSSSASGWTSVSSTTSYSGSVSYTLSGGEGSKPVYVWYKDAAGNVSSSASDDITLDTTAPTITITSPTSDAAYTATSSTISLGGSASDSTSGIKEVMWTNSSGGSGTASGTTSWTISSISLSNGDNTITVISTDNAGNTAVDTITVTYKSTSTNVPKVSTGSVTNITENSATLNGTVNANGLTTTAWFYYGTNSGSYIHTSSTQTISGSSDTAVGINVSGLSAGTKYYYKLTTQNSAGTSTGSEASFTTKTVSTTPTPTTSPLPTLPPFPTPQASPSPVQEGIHHWNCKRPG